MRDEERKGDKIAFKRRDERDRPHANWPMSRLSVPKQVMDGPDPDAWDWNSAAVCTLD